jgi:FAD/FMN-containing dehydrogenase
MVIFHNSECTFSPHTEQDQGISVPSIELLKGPILVQESGLDIDSNENKSAPQTPTNTEQENTNKVVIPEDEKRLFELMQSNDKFHIIGNFNGKNNNGGLRISLEKFSEIHCCDHNTIYVGAGVKYRDLIKELGQRKLAVEQVGNSPDAEVVSSIINGGHSGKLGARLLGEGVAEVTMVLPNGNRRVYSAHDPEFGSVLVNFGYGGVVLGVSLNVVPEFRVLRCVYEGILHYDFTRKFRSMFQNKDYSWFFWDLKKMKWTVHQVIRLGETVPIKGNQVVLVFFM